MSKTPSRAFLKELVSDQSFVTATGGALQNHPRMADREVALRFVAFRLFTSDEYAQHDSFDEFLGFVTDRLDDSTSESLDEIRTDFVRGMTNSYSVFGEHAFRKWPLDAIRKSPINRALFESWGTVLADYDETVVRSVAKDLVKCAREMMTTDFEFINSISGSTGDVRNVRTRLGKVRAAAGGGASVIAEIRLENFKRFRNLTLKTANLTVLTGANGAGKTSILHSLLLARQMVRRPDKTHVEFNGVDTLELGGPEDVIHREASDDLAAVEVLDTDGTLRRWSFRAKSTVDMRTLNATVVDRPDDYSGALAGPAPQFSYLCAERLGPRDVPQCQCGRCGRARCRLTRRVCGAGSSVIRSIAY